VGPSLWLLILANIFHFAIDFALEGVTLRKSHGWPKVWGFLVFSQSVLNLMGFAVWFPKDK